MAVHTNTTQSGQDLITQSLANEARITFGDAQVAIMEYLDLMGRNPGPTFLDTVVALVDKQCEDIGIEHDIEGYRVDETRTVRWCNQCMWHEDL